jgi:hypothetical protein
VSTPSSLVRERDKEREKETERGREGERERIVIFIFKRMTVALAPFSYLVAHTLKEFLENYFSS